MLLVKVNIVCCGNENMCVNARECDVFVVAKASVVRGDEGELVVVAMMIV